MGHILHAQFEPSEPLALPKAALLPTPKQSEAVFAKFAFAAQAHRRKRHTSFIFSSPWPTNSAANSCLETLYSFLLPKTAQSLSVHTKYSTTRTPTRLMHQPKPMHICFLNEGFFHRIPTQTNTVQRTNGCLQRTTTHQLKSLEWIPL